MLMKQKTILLVEDNPDDVLLTRRALQKNHFPHQLQVVHNGHEAMHYLQDAVDQNDATPLPTAILLDLKLPLMDGLEVLRRIRAHEQLKRLPVMMLTTSGEHHDLVQSYDLGGQQLFSQAGGL